MPLGIRGSNPIWTEVDLQGNLFDDTFYLFVLTNTIPYVPSPVYHDPDLNVAWNNPIRFLGNGTLPVDIFFVPETVYRLEFRQGNTQQDPLIYEVNNYIPGEGGVTPVDTVAFPTSNQITNPQFSLISFSSPFTFSGTDPDPIEVAPGWFLELGGTGTVTLTQVPLNSTNANITNAPYALEINLSGWNTDEVFLRQRFEQNGMLWANKTVSSSITARLQGAPQFISATLFDSQNAPLIQVLQPVEINQAYNEYTGYGTLLVSTNTDTPPSAYIDYKLALPSTIDIYVTSFQLIVQDLPVKPTFEQDSIDRQIDHTFHYYRESVLRQAKESLLTGWDFGLNPWQFRTTTQTNLATFGYTADQTIMVQQLYVATGVGNAISVGRTLAADNYGFRLASVNAANQFAMIQYIDPTTVRSSWGSIVSSLVRLNALKQSSGLSMRVKMRLIYRASLPPILAQNEPILSWTSGGSPVYTSDWTVIVPKNDPVYNLTNGFNELLFEGFQLPASSNDQMTLGIVIYTLDNMLSTGTPDSITFYQVSLIQSEFAAESTKLSFAETLVRCQFYYEKSYDFNILPATASSHGALINQLSGQMYYNVYQTVGGINSQFTALANTDFYIQYNTAKRTSSPLVNLYSPNGSSAGNVLAQGFNNGALILNTVLAVSSWAVTDDNKGNKGIRYIVVSPNAKLYDNQQTNANPAAIVGAFINGYITYHFTSNALLGIVT